MPAGDPLTEGDALAARVLEALTPLRFAESRGAGDDEAAFGLRYRAVVERAMAGAGDFRDRLERDEDDSRAVQIVGWDGDLAMATCRLVLPRDDRPLPIERLFDVRLHEDARAVELGRAVVDPRYRGRGHGGFMGLAARFWLAMRGRGFTSVLAATPPRLVALFESLGFAIEVLGPARTHWRQERYPILCDGAATIPGLRRTWLTGSRATVRGGLSSG